MGKFLLGVATGLALVFLPAAALVGGWRPAGRAATANPAELIREE